MEKYGVVIEAPPSGEKQASEKKVCPRCGSELDINKHCPIHGTEPFEKKE